MDFERAIPIVVTASFVGFLLIERWFPARPQVRVRGWTVTGVLSFVMTGALSAALPLLYIKHIRAHRLLDLEALGTFGGAALGFIAADFVLYWLHRARHAQPLWRFHQMHHAAERLDVAGAAYQHLFDVVATNFCA